MSFYWRKQATPGRLGKIATMRMQLDYIEKCLHQKGIPTGDAAMLAKNAADLAVELSEALGGHKERLRNHNEKKGKK